MSDRALRRLAARLAETRSEDIDAVLEALEPAHRRRVASLIGDYAGTPRQPDERPLPPAPEAAPAPDLEGLSPWLAIRAKAAFEGDGTGSDVPPRRCAFALAPAAIEALAREIPSLPAKPRQPPRPLANLFASRVGNPFRRAAT